VTLISDSPPEIDRPPDIISLPFLLNYAMYGECVPLGKDLSGPILPCIVFISIVLPLTPELTSICKFLFVDNLQLGVMVS